MGLLLFPFYRRGNQGPERLVTRTSCTVAEPGSTNSSERPNPQPGAPRRHSTYPERRTSRSEAISAYRSLRRRSSEVPAKPRAASSDQSGPSTRARPLPSLLPTGPGLLPVLERERKLGLAQRESGAGVYALQAVPDGSTRRQRFPGFSLTPRPPRTFSALLSRQGPPQGARKGRSECRKVRGRSPARGGSKPRAGRAGCLGACAVV